MTCSLRPFCGCTLLPSSSELDIDEQEADPRFQQCSDSRREIVVPTFSCSMIYQSCIFIRIFIVRNRSVILLLEFLLLIFCQFLSSSTVLYQYYTSKDPLTTKLTGFFLAAILLCSSLCSLNLSNLSFSLIPSNLSSNSFSLLSRSSSFVLISCSITHSGSPLKESDSETEERIELIREVRS